MATLPSLKRILQEDFPTDTQKWIGKLLGPLNDFMDRVTNGFANGLTVNENLNGQVKVVTVSEIPFEWKWPRTAKPVGVWAVAATDSQAVSVTSSVLTWEFTTAGNIRVTALPALSPAPTTASPYTVTFIAIAG